jgi:hypothetical protein
MNIYIIYINNILYIYIYIINIYNKYLLYILHMYTYMNKFKTIPPEAGSEQVSLLDMLTL